MLLIITVIIIVRSSDRYVAYRSTRNVPIAINHTTGHVRDSVTCNLRQKNYEHAQTTPKTP